MAQRLQEVRRRIAAAAAHGGRDPEAVTLVAVSKSFPVEAVAEAARAGHVHFGESRAQELRDKSRVAGEGIRWHFLGRLQRNKVKYVVGSAELIHSVDSEELAVGIGDRARRLGITQEVLVQANAGEDPAKAGFGLDALTGAIERVRSIDGVTCRGIMTIPPMGVDPRGSFRALRRARDTLREQYPEVTELSMGMSADFEVAVEEGATIVRVGEAVFGPRQQRTTSITGAVNV